MNTEEKLHYLELLVGLIGALYVDYEGDKALRTRAKEKAEEVIDSIDIPNLKAS